MGKRPGKQSSYLGQGHAAPIPGCHRALKVREDLLARREVVLFVVIVRGKQLAWKSDQRIIDAVGGAL